MAKLILPTFGLLFLLSAVTARKHYTYRDFDDSVSSDDSSDAKEVFRKISRRGLSPDSRTVANSSDIVNIVSIHNKYRRQEGASNMLEMSYSTYLADMASEWAKRCNFSHGHPPRPDAPWSWIGQNLFASSVQKVNFTRVILSWYAERSRYVYDRKSCLPGLMCGHYTAIVWWETYAVGCGYAICPKLLESSIKNAAFVVCNYGPGGNYKNEYPFSKGKACSACPRGTTCNLGLCKRR